MSGLAGLGWIRLGLAGLNWAGLGWAWLVAVSEPRRLFLRHAEMAALGEWRRMRTLAGLFVPGVFSWIARRKSAPLCLACPALLLAGGRRRAACLFRTDALVVVAMRPPCRGPVAFNRRSVCRAGY